MKKPNLKLDIKKMNFSNVASYLKNLSRKAKIIVISIVMSLPIVLGAFFSLPGMGIESLKFIGSVEDFIEENIPEGKYVLDTKKTGMGSVTNPVIANALESSYLADVMSAINWDNPEEYNPVRIETYKAFTHLWFVERWGEDLENGTPIDLYDVSMDLIEFDEAVAGQFFEYGFVNPGITWMFQPETLSRLFDTNVENTIWFEDVVTKQTVIDQTTYDSLVQANGPGLTGIEVTHSVGSNIVNNKVWFLNIQRKNIEFMLNNPINLFVGDEKPSGLPDIATPDDLYHPNFVSGFRLMQAGVSFLFIIGPISLIAGGVGIHFVKKKNPKEVK